jgi:hypothetical protein
MVFTEVCLITCIILMLQENSNIHIIDAKTLNTHVIVPVPYYPPSEAGVMSTISGSRPRNGHDGGTWGIAGIGFDPTGDWLYSGTERTVVEWDLRRLGGGEGGTWEMA